MAVSLSAFANFLGIMESCSLCCMFASSVSSEISLGKKVVSYKNQSINSFIPGF